MSDADPPADLVYRTRLPVRLWHWTNALTIFIMLMTGMMIFNAHPRLYWGAYGANFDHAWLEIGNRGTHGYLTVLGVEVPTTGVLGYAMHTDEAFPPLVTLPGQYNVPVARIWHFFFAWVLVIGWLGFAGYALLSRHLWNDLLLKREELRPASLWHDIKAHARLHLPRGEAARHYNPLQKLAYLGVLLIGLPLMVLSGLTMSPAMDAAWPWLLVLFDGRQSARSVHFIVAAGLALFIVVHLAMVVLAGPFNELRSMITGWYRLPPERPTTEDRP
ncbi:cytochrome b/b6 domain-containing protein [Novosphingobium sp. FSW06-99]|uniref:cytochrome b/b6 domain-containing protein n=1 Tax=Novosphingobium sp. FSW06-99 TaxID=1739113 RepID=UPI00076D18C7|nr:cytochrome b/b6 domain-containing protein [Novosphingobium sp. FSW06-99]KUR80653.1 HupC [Novosphingobium sp. FSW06-99]